MMRRFLFMGCVALLLCSFVNISCAQKTGVGVGDQAPDFTLKDANGNSVSLKEVISKNKATLLVFWASWCSYCFREVPELNRLNDSHKDRGLGIYGVNVGESARKVESAIKSKGMTYTILLDQTNKVASQYRVTGIPANILIDKDGVIKYRGTAPPSEGLLP